MSNSTPASSGMSFDDAIENCGKGEKITFGTRSEKWHVIDSNDRYFNTRFSLTKTKAKKLGEMQSALAIA